MSISQGKWFRAYCDYLLVLSLTAFFRDFITVFRKANNPEGAAGRHPVTRQLHGSHLNSMGRDEEWGADGHEKLAETMDIHVYGLIDKFSRLELLLLAVPNARIPEVVLLLYLRLIKRLKSESNSSCFFALYS